MLHLGEVSGLADSVDPTECDNVGLALVLGLHHVPQDVDSALGAQDLHQTLLHAGPHQTLDAWGGRVMVALGLPLHAPPTTSHCGLSPTHHQSLWIKPHPPPVTVD